MDKHQYIPKNEYCRERCGEYGFSMCKECKRTSDNILIRWITPIFGITAVAIFFTALLSIYVICDMNFTVLNPYHIILITLFTISVSSVRFLVANVNQIERKCHMGDYYYD